MQAKSSLSPFPPLSLLPITVVMTLVSCDPSSMPEVCNGFGTPIVLTLYSEGQAKKYVASYSSGECKSLAALLPVSLEDEFDGKGGAKKFPTGLIVSSAAGETLASYSPDVTHSLGGGVGQRPPWIMTARGLFRVPDEFVKNWEANISSVERLSADSFPNRLKQSE